MREKPKVQIHGLTAVVGDDLIALAPELGDGIGYGVVEAFVESEKLIRRDRRLLLDGHLGNGLAEIPIIVDNLIHGEPLE